MTGRTKVKGVLLLLVLLIGSMLLIPGVVGAQGSNDPPPPPDLSGNPPTEPDGGLGNNAVDLFVSVTTWIAKRMGYPVSSEEEIVLPKEVTIFNLWQLQLWPNFLDGSPLNSLIYLGTPWMLLGCLGLVVIYVIQIISNIKAKEVDIQSLVGFGLAIVGVTLFASASAEILMVPIVIANKVVEGVGNNVLLTVSDPLPMRLAAVYTFFRNTNPGELFQVSAKVAALMGFMMYEYSAFSLALRLMGIFGPWLAIIALLVSRNPKPLWLIVIAFFALCFCLATFAIGLQVVSAYLTDSEFIVNLDKNLPGALLLLITGPPLATLLLLISIKIGGREIQKQVLEARLTT